MKDPLKMLTTILFLGFYVLISANSNLNNFTNKGNSDQIDFVDTRNIDVIISELEKKSGGVIGVMALDIEQNTQYVYNKDVNFPLASTLKIPVAIQFLNKVDLNEISLSDMIEIKKSDLHPGSGIIVKYFEDLGISLSLKNLMRLMLTESDNTAADLCIKYSGGTKAVNKRLNEIGIQGMSVDRPTYVALANYLGVQNVSEYKEYDDEKVVSELRNLSREERENAAINFLNDGKDNSTPEAMVRLLRKIWNEEILSKENSQLLLNTMKECNTGDNRIKGLLPKETIVYHKTGTIGNVTNDVGIITLPEDLGNIAISVFVKEAKVDTKESELIIAQISRLLYDYFIINSDVVLDKSKDK